MSLRAGGTYAGAFVPAVHEPFGYIKTRPE